MIGLGLNYSTATDPSKSRESPIPITAVCSPSRCCCLEVGDGSALAAIETAARLWGSGLASASVKPDTLALSVCVSCLPYLTPWAVRLCRSGEVAACDRHSQTDG